MHDVLLNFVIKLFDASACTRVALHPDFPIKIRNDHTSWSDTGERVSHAELDALVDYLRGQSVRQGADGALEIEERGRLFSAKISGGGVIVSLIGAATASSVPAAVPRDPSPAQAASPAPASEQEAARSTYSDPEHPHEPKSAAAPPTAPRAVAQTNAELPEVGTLPIVPEAGILRWRQSVLERFAAIVGLLLGVVLVLLVHGLTPPESVIGRMCDVKHTEGMVTMAVAVIFFWSLTLCLVRFLMLGRLESVSSARLLTGIARNLATEGLDAQVEALQAAKAPYSPLIRRLAAVVRQWQLKPGLQESSLILHEQAAGDEENAQSIYGTIRAFVWALPVLGLIGTVIGIGSAVGDFASFLGGKVDDVAAIKQSLIGVTSNLSFAFYITLEGLLTSLVVMLTASALEARDSIFNQRLSQEISDVFMPILQVVAPDRTGAALGDSDASALKENLEHIASSVINSFAETAREERERAGKEVSGWTSTVRQQLEQTATAVGESLVSAGRVHASAMGNMTGDLGRLADVVRDQNVLIDGQTEIANRFTDGAKEFVGALTGCMRPIAQLEKAMAGLADGDTQRALAQLADTMSEASRASGQTMILMTELKRQTSDLLHAQAALQTALSEFRDSGVNGSLTELRETLAQLSHSLEGLRQPFVFQAVPARQS